MAAILSQARAAKALVGRELHLEQSTRIGPERLVALRFLPTPTGLRLRLVHVRVDGVAVLEEHLLDRGGRLQRALVRAGPIGVKEPARLGSATRSGEALRWTWEQPQARDETQALPRPTLPSGFALGVLPSLYPYLPARFKATLLFEARLLGPATLRTLKDLPALQERWLVWELSGKPGPRVRVSTAASDRGRVLEVLLPGGKRYMPISPERAKVLLAALALKKEAPPPAAKSPPSASKLPLWTEARLKPLLGTQHYADPARRVCVRLTLSRRPGGWRLAERRVQRASEQVQRFDFNATGALQSFVYSVTKRGEQAPRERMEGKVKAGELSQRYQAQGQQPLAASQPWPQNALPLPCALFVLPLLRRAWPGPSLSLRILQGGTLKPTPFSLSGGPQAFVLSSAGRSIRMQLEPRALRVRSFEAGQTFARLSASEGRALVAKLRKP